MDEIWRAKFAKCLEVICTVVYGGKMLLLDKPTVVSVEW
jgi:hypothetical protein